MENYWKQQEKLKQAAVNPATGPPAMFHSGNIQEFIHYWWQYIIFIMWKDDCTDRSY